MSAAKQESFEGRDDRVVPLRIVQELGDKALPNTQDSSSQENDSEGWGQDAKGRARLQENPQFDFYPDNN